MMLFEGTKWTPLLKGSAFSYSFADRDGDTYGDPYGALFAPAPLPGYVPDSSDCDDTNPLISPAASEVCDGIDNNCNGLIDDNAPCPAFQACDGGMCVNCCFNNGGNACTGATTLGTICGDTGGGPINVSGCGEAWYRITLQECSGSDIDLIITVTLVVPVGMDYDLYLYAPCNTLVGSSTNSGNATEQIIYTINDNLFADNTTTFYIRVDHFSGGQCSNWVMSITGG